MENSSIITEPLGESGWLVHLPNENAAIQFSNYICNIDLNYINEIIPAYSSVAVLFHHDAETSEAIDAEIKTVINNFNFCSYENNSDISQLLEVPVIYDGADLDLVARVANLSVNDLVSWHCAADYRVFAVGFQPGFPYCGYLPERIAGIPRRSSPRTSVPAGSVAIAGQQTGIYPQTSPGGWNLLGRTDLELVDLDRGFFRFAPGDMIRFLPQAGGIMPEAGLIEEYRGKLAEGSSR
jgi:inhibitor of KinA